MLLTIDRGYIDYGWLADLSEQGVYFVTRMKDNADYTAQRCRVYGGVECGRRGRKKIGDPWQSIRS
jgi:hypothetical protein